MAIVRGKPLNPKKQKHCNQGKNIFDFDPCLSLVDTRFVLLFLELTKKILASVYERLNESSIIPPLKNRFLASDFMKIFNYHVLLFLKTRAQRYTICLCFCFLGFGACPIKAQSRNFTR